MLAAELVGFAAGIARWRLLDRAQRLITLWLGAGGGFDIAALVAERTIHNTQVIAKLWFAASVVLAVGAMAALQGSRRRATAYRAVAIGYLMIWLVLVLTAENPMGYSKFLSPLHAVVLLGVGVATLLRRVALAREDLLLDSGFVLATGLIGYAAPSALQGPVVQLFVHDQLQTAVVYYGVRDGIATLAMLVMIRALFLPASAPLRSGR